MHLLSGGHTLNVTVDLSDDHPQYSGAPWDPKAKLMPVFVSSDTISGRVVLTLGRSALDHDGIEVRLIGRLTANGLRQSSPATLLDKQQLLLPPGRITESKAFRFQFASLDFPTESYYGKVFMLEYAVEATVRRNFGKLTAAYPIAAVVLKPVLDAGPPPKMLDVGIKRCLHINISFESLKVHLDHTMIAQVSFHLSRINIQAGRVMLQRREVLYVAGADKPSVKQSSLADYQFLDGPPVEPECLPIRFSLRPYPLTPTIKMRGKFGVRYVISVVLTDKENRRYYKETELLLFRRDLPSPAFAKVEWGPFPASALCSNMRHAPPDSLRETKSAAQMRAARLYHLAAGHK